MDSLGITAVIATVLSAIFAAAALWNSILRRRHEAQMAQLQEPETEKFSFKPVPSTPVASNHPGTSRHGQTHTNPHAHTHPHSPARKTTPPPGAESPAPPPLFRQIRPTGEVEDDYYPEDEDMYVWE